jgi:hypothetical protein
LLQHNEKKRINEKKVKGILSEKLLWLTQKCLNILKKKENEKKDVYRFLECVEM